ncbi:MAG: APC family permease [Phycisphaerae bacterium]|nr:APC family permease [Phycisphaerae bacterium]
MATDQPTPTTRATLGLTALTSNAMALIAPGAFLWLTYGQQSAYGAPVAASAMWIGIVFATLLCLATAISYAELSKLYPGAGSSYFFAEQAFLSKSTAYKWARIAKFMVGWASHLYYWVYPGLMVGVTALVSGYMLGQIWPSVFSSGVPSPLFMYLFCIVFAFGVSYIAFRGIGGTTGVNAAINAIQISALIIFSVMAIGHRLKTPENAPAWTLDSTGTPTQFVQDTMHDTSSQDPAATVPAVDKAGNPIWKKDAQGQPILNTISYKGGFVKDDKGNATFNYHDSPASVVHWHSFSYVIVQACIAILILVGFESVTAMGEEARNAKRDIPRAVILSLLIQGGFCYLLEYFAANYFLSSSYTSVQAAASSAPIGDQMQLVGAWAFGSARAGWWYMMIMAITVLLALIGTTLSCMSTGARVTYAMGRDEEMGAHFGLLHGKRLTPHRAIWTLAAISAVIGIAAVLFNFCGPVAQTDATITGLPHNLWYSFGTFTNATATKIPCSLIIVTLVSNFGTFLLYMMTCIVTIVAFRQHDSFHGFKHVVVPIFGLAANLVCMAFYIIGPFVVPGMSVKEPFVALGIAALWGIYGAIYFVHRSKKLGRGALLTTPVGASSMAASVG